MEILQAVAPQEPGVCLSSQAGKKFWQLVVKIVMKVYLLKRYTALCDVGAKGEERFFPEWIRTFALDVARPLLPTSSMCNYIVKLMFCK